MPCEKNKSKIEAGDAQQPLIVSIVSGMKLTKVYDMLIRLAILIFGLALTLTAAAADVKTDNLYFPIIEYATPDAVKFVMLKSGESDKASCERGAAQVAEVIRATCPTCKIAQRCAKGLDVQRKKVLGNSALATPSVRLPDDKLTMTIAAADPIKALAVCRQTEEQTASKPVAERLRCHPAKAAR